jgi:hypothetical protein
MTSLEVRERAERYRQIAADMAYPGTIDALHEMATRCEAVAAKLEAWDKPSPEED